MSARVVLAEVTVPQTLDQERVDAAAVVLFELPSKNRAKKELKAARMLLDDQIVETSRRVHVGQRLTLLAPDAPPPVHARAVEVVWEDPHMAVVVKPAGLVTSGNRARTLERALPFNLAPSEADDALPWPRPVHRLDAGTSGLVLVARSLAAQVALGRALEARTVRKRYRAILVGRLEGEGRVDHPVDGRDAQSRWCAIAHVRCLHVDWVTAVDLWPETGRTHQLRQHCALLGHPVLGDTLYGAGRILRGQGLYLTAVALHLDHPVSGEPMEIEIEPAPKFGSYLRREARRWASTYPASE